MASLMIPVRGTVGEGGCERLFCGPAHQVVARDAQVLEADCPYLDGEEWLCGMTGYRRRCLFADLDSPDWQAIAQSQVLASQNGHGSLALPSPVPMVEGDWLARLEQLEAAFLSGLITASELAAERELVMGLVASAVAAVR